HCEYIDDQSRCTQLFQSVLHRYASILRARPVIQNPGENEPDSKVSGRANQKEERVHVSSAMTQHIVVHDLIMICPGIKIRKAECDGKKEHCEQRQCAAAGLVNPARDDTPGAAGEVLRHHQRHATEREAKPEQVAKEISAEKLPGIEERADDAGNQQHDASTAELN